MPTGYWARRRQIELGPGDGTRLLSIPDKAKGLIVFACAGAGGSRHRVTIRTAATLHSRRFATLLCDPRSNEGGRTKAVDVELPDCRIAEAVKWARANGATRALPVGLFGEGDGAAATLVAAANLPDSISAIVVRGDRPDLAGSALGHVFAPTLLIASASDHSALKHNQDANQRLTCVKQLEIIPAALAGHDALHAANNAAGHWFDLYLLPRAAVQASAAGRR